MSEERVEQAVNAPKDMTAPPFLQTAKAFGSGVFRRPFRAKTQRRVQEDAVQRFVASAGRYLTRFGRETDQGQGYDRKWMIGRC